MRLTRTIPVVAALLTWALVMAPVASGQSVVSRVAIANPVKIFGQLQKTLDLRKQMETRTGALDQQRIAKSNEIRDLQSKRDLLNKNAPDYQTLQKEIIEKTVNLQAWMQINKLEIERTQKEQILHIFDEITAAIGKVAEQKGIEIVVAEMKPEIPVDLEPVTVEQLRILLGQRNVLYSKAIADISEAVITQMDADYKAGR